MTAPEKDYYATIIEGAHLYGWTIAHFRPARTNHGWRTAVQGDGAGFPDFVAVHPRAGVLFLEVKRDRAKLDPAQSAWAKVLTDAGVPYRLVWVPTDLPDLWRELADRARPRHPRHPLVAAMLDAEDEDRRTK